MRIKDKETGEAYEVNGSYFDRKKCSDGRIYLKNLAGIDVPDISMRKFMTDYEPVAPTIIDFEPIAVSKLSGLEIADKDYVEGDKKYFTYDEAMEVQEKLKLTGWRLPTRKEWVLICEEFACGDDGDLHGQLLSERLRLGLNGWQYHEDQRVRSVGGYGYYWSSVASSATNARYLYFDAAYVYPSHSYYRAYGFSVRLVRDLHKEAQND